MNKIISIVILFIVIKNSYAQTLDWGYKWTYGSASTDVTRDSFGNTYTISIGSTQTNFNMTASGSNIPGVSAGCAAISKIDISGNLIWTKFISKAGGTGGGAIPQNIRFSANSITIAGVFGGGWGQYDFDPGVGTAYLSGPQNLSGFVLRLDSDGNYLWHKEIGVNGACQINDLFVDQNQNTYLTGTFGPSISISNVPACLSNGNNDVFFAKLDVNGNCLFLKNIGSDNATGMDLGSGITVDGNGNVLLTGRFYGNVDFDPSSAITSLNSNGFSDIFIAKYDQLGNFLWVKQIGGSSSDAGNDILFDSSGNIVLTGFAYGNVDFNPSTGTNNINYPNQYCFLLKLDSNGNYLSSFGYPAATLSQGDLLATNSNTLILIGSYLGLMDLDNSNNLFEVNTVGNQTSLFVITLDQGLSFISGGSINLTGFNQWVSPKGVHLNSNSFVIGGIFEGTIDIDLSTNSSINLSSLTSNTGIPGQSNFITHYNFCTTQNVQLNEQSCETYNWNGQSYNSSGTYTQTFQSIDGCDSTVTLNLTIYTPSSSSFSASSCEPYTWNGNTYASSGQYSQTLTGVNGCDSIVTLNLTILNGPNAQITSQDGLVLIANNVPGASYQWIYCSDLTPVPNQTLMQFAPQINGTYAVVISDNCGSDTSECYTVSTIGLNDINIDYSIAPNPARNNLIVTIPEFYLQRNYMIYDLEGRLLKKGSASTSKIVISIEDLKPGSYILNIEGASAKKFVRE